MLIGSLVERRGAAVRNARVADPAADARLGSSGPSRSASSLGSCWRSGLACHSCWGDCCRPPGRSPRTKRSKSRWRYGLLTSGTIYVSTLCKSGVAALAWSFAAVAGTIAFVGTLQEAAERIVIRRAPGFGPSDWQSRRGPCPCRGVLDRRGLRRRPADWLGFLNHTSMERGARRTSKQVLGDRRLHRCRHCRCSSLWRCFDRLPFSAGPRRRRSPARPRGRRADSVRYATLRSERFAQECPWQSPVRPLRHPRARGR